MNSSSQTVSAASIINFWFDEKTQPHWFNATTEFDQQLRIDYEHLVDQALNGELSSWQESADGCLALIILLDQMPLNMYRGEKKSFVGEGQAIQLSKHVITAGFDKQFTDAMRAFLYMPLMHSENLADQDLSVQMFEQAGLNGNLHWAKHHRELVRRFGRFPHRNQILGRENSAEEEAYLASDQAFLG